MSSGVVTIARRLLFLLSLRALFTGIFCNFRKHFFDIFFTSVFFPFRDKLASGARNGYLNLLIILHFNMFLQKNPELFSFLFDKGKI